MSFGDLLIIKDRDYLITDLYLFEIPVSTVSKMSKNLLICNLLIHLLIQDEE